MINSSFYWDQGYATVVNNVAKENQPFLAELTFVTVKVET